MNGTTIPVAGVTKPAETLLRQVIVVKSPLRGRPPTPRQSVSREAQRIAAALLEVLAGVRTPTDAAAALNISIARYYLWEKRALEGFVSACEPRPPGEYANHQHENGDPSEGGRSVAAGLHAATGAGASFAADDRLSAASATRPEIWQEGHGKGWRPRHRKAETQAAAYGAGAEGSGGTAGQSRHGGATGSFVFSDPGRSGTTD